MKVGERAFLLERGSAELSRAGITYNLQSPAIFPKGVGLGDGSTWEEKGGGGGQGERKDSEVT